jgi:hypothetical protein
VGGSEQQKWHIKEERTTPYRSLCDCSLCVQARTRVVNVYPELTNVGCRIINGFAENA